MAMANEHEFPQSLLGNPSGVVGIFKPGPPQFDPMKILRIHGYKNMEKIRPVIRKTAAEYPFQADGRGRMFRRRLAFGEWPCVHQSSIY
jgi:hypothetical protein